MSNESTAESPLQPDPGGHASTSSRCSLRPVGALILLASLERYEEIIDLAYRLADQCEGFKNEDTVEGRLWVALHEAQRDGLVELPR